ncbi:MAG: GPI mannosyltransferase 1 [Ramalina farinacea]|uniref:GPI mannosyltransferase 1 n=1 Tax=Ramalina farinacea TaxID=258253 RepID=A0AA43QSI5_9LECA|nr:GPI mannosyltransferase 1 [Ramalina farinacea]
MTLFTPFKILSLSLLLRLSLLLYGLFQDAHSPLPYTDVDYYVFTDAARFVAHSASPYARATYRYTPLLAYILHPTTWSPQYMWFSFGKVLFAASDIVAGWLIYLILSVHWKQKENMRALKFASVWLLNPFVATISTRGSSEGLLGVMVIGLLYAILRQQVVFGGVLLGLGVHFKIYPVIYAPALVLYLSSAPQPSPSTSSPFAYLYQQAIGILNRANIILTLTSLTTFTILTLAMYHLEGWDFIQHTYLHHLTRSDHRHNFSAYNTLLHLSSAYPALGSSSFPPFERLAFLPQIILSAILIPLALAKRDIASCMLTQTYAFVGFNKVVTSQYFVWYLVLLPLYLPESSFLRRPRLGLLALALWVGSQAVWLQQGYQLEFLGSPTFWPGLWGSGVGFLAVNCWILGVMIQDIRIGRGEEEQAKTDGAKKLKAL